MNLFSIDDKGLLVVDNNEILAAPEFVAIIKKNKELLKLIWFVADTRSPISSKGISMEEKISEALKRFNFKLDDIDMTLITKAINYYESCKNSAEILVDTLRTGFNISNIIANETIKAIQKYTETELNIDEAKSLLSHIKTLKEIASSLPKELAALKEAEYNLSLSNENRKLLAGGRPIAPSAIVD